MQPASRPQSVLPTTVPYWPQPVQPQFQPQPQHQPQPVSNPVHHPIAPPQPHRTTTTRSSFFFAESAALLTLFSLFIFIQGGIRVNRAEDEFSGFPYGALLSASICEMLLALLGICLGLSSLICRFFNACIFVNLAVLVQIFLSIFVFVIYNLALPIYLIVERPPLQLGYGSDQATYRAAAIFALLTSAQFTFALYAGQLFFLNRLSAAATGNDVWRSRTGNRMQAFAWNINFLLAGLWTFAFGMVVLLSPDNFFFFDFRSLFFFIHPHIGDLPGMTVAAGVLMMVWALTGIVLLCLRVREVGWYMIASIFVTLFVYLNFTLVQFGTSGAGIGGGGYLTVNAMLVFVTCFLGPYCLYRAVETESETHEL